MKRATCFIVFRETIDTGWVRVHAGRLQVSESPKLVPVSSGTNAASLLSESLPLFGLEGKNPDDFAVAEVIMHKGGTRNSPFPQCRLSTSLFNSDHS